MKETNEDKGFNWERLKFIRKLACWAFIGWCSVFIRLKTVEGDQMPGVGRENKKNKTERTNIVNEIQKYRVWTTVSEGERGGERTRERESMWTRNVLKKNLRNGPQYTVIPLPSSRIGRSVWLFSISNISWWSHEIKLIGLTFMLISEIRAYKTSSQLFTGKAVEMSPGTNKGYNVIVGRTEILLNGFCERQNGWGKEGEESEIK